MIWLVLIVALVVLLRIAMPHLGGSRAVGFIEIDGRPALAGCSAAPNCQSSEAKDDAHRVERLQSALPLTDALDTLISIIEAEPGARIVARDGNYLHATWTSRVMGFVDDVEVLADATSNTLHVRSASRLGHSDLGANAARIEHLRQSLAKAN